MSADVRAPITAQEAIALINQAAKADPERAHADADDVLLRFLRGLGYGDVADAWEKIEPKWYA